YLTTGFARALARAPQARLLRRLVIQASPNYAEEDEGGDEGEGDDEGADRRDEGDEVWPLHPLRRAAYLSNVRVFQLGEQYQDTKWGGASCHTNGDGVVGLIKKKPRLEELYLMAHRVDTRALFGLKTLTNLRVLEVDHLHDYPLETLARNKALGRLQSVSFHPHGLDHEHAYIRLPGLRAVLRSPHL